MGAVIGTILSSILNIFKFHKKKVLFFIASLLFSVFILFPYNDLSDFASSQISKATRNQVNVEFDKIGFGFMPQLGVQMADVDMDFAFGASKFPNLKLGSLGIAPNLFKSIMVGLTGKVKSDEAMTLIKKIHAGDLFDGDIDLYLSGSDKLGGEVKGVNLQIDVEKLNLKKLTKYTKKALNGNFAAQGLASLVSDIVFDPTFKEQPDGTYELNIKDLNIPGSTQMVPFGGASLPFSIPGLKLDSVKLRGKIADRRLEIIEGKLGDVKNDLWGEISGDIVLNLRAGGRLDPGGYNIVLDLNLKEAMLTQLGPMSAILDGMLGKYKFSTTNGVRYKVRIKGNKLGANARPPQFSNP